MNINLFFLIHFLIIICIRTVHSIHGCVPLDTYSFEKIVSKFRVSLVKFDSAYPYGKKQDEYEKLCSTVRGINDLLIAEVAVKDYGEKDNVDLAEKFNVKKDDFPVVKLIVEGKEKPFTFLSQNDDDFVEENLKAFIRKHSNIYIGMQGCLEEFDSIAERFIKSNDVHERKRLLSSAEDLWDKAKVNTERQSAEVYVKYMRKILEIGNSFVDNENNRIKSIVKGKVSQNKITELENKINILQSFKEKDEL